MNAFFETTGSTRLAGVMRILTVLVVWSRFAAGMVPAFGSSPTDYVLSAVFWSASPLAFVGLFTRPAMLLTGAAGMGAYYLQGVAAGNSNLSSHHVFALALLCCLMALTPCGRSFSVDRLRTGLPEVGPVWGQRILAIQTTVLYLGAVYEKSYGAWLDGSRMTHFAQQIVFGSDLPDGAWFGALMVVAAVSTWGIEFALAVLIWVPRAKAPAWLLGFVFHGLVYAFTPVATYSVTMYVFLLSALDPEAFDRWTRRVPALAVPGSPVGLVLLPLVLVPLVPSLYTPHYEGMERLGLATCDVWIEHDGQRIRPPPALRSQGRAGVERYAAKVCKRYGPVTVQGRCGSVDGWEPVDLVDWCEPVPAAPGATRRISAR